MRRVSMNANVRKVSLHRCVAVRYDTRERFEHSVLG